MRLPKSIKVGPLTYDVVYDDTYLDQISSENQRVDGLCEPWRARITLRTTPAEGMKRVVLFHEAVHAAWDQSSLAADNEEAVVEALDSPLLEIFDRNPALRRALWGDKN